MSELAQSTAFDIYATFQQFLQDDEVSLPYRLLCGIAHSSAQISPPLAAILSLAEAIVKSNGA